jgi:hypothetical protein
MLTYDFCSNPTHLRLHGTFSFYFPRESKLRPLFQWSKHLRNPEFLTTPLEAYENHTSSSAKHKYTPWEKKVDNRVFWRGSSTGDFYVRDKHGREVDWRESHRPRLGLMTQVRPGGAGGPDGHRGLGGIARPEEDEGAEGYEEAQGPLGVRGQEVRDVWIQRGKEWRKEEWVQGKLNEVYTDIGLTGYPHQVSRVVYCSALRTLSTEISI